MRRPAGLFSALQAVVIGLLMPAALLLAAGCGRRETDVARGSRTQVLHRGLGSDPAEIDPHLISALAEINVASALFEGLVAEDPRNLHPIPATAEGWDITPDGLTYTFRIRAAARWSDGRPVTAMDFIASFRRALTPSIAADCAAMFDPVRNASAYRRGSLADFSQVGFEAPDPRTLRITLEHPTADFLQRLSHPVFYPVPVPLIERCGPVGLRGNRWTKPGTIVGNGPFVLKEWAPNRIILVAKSPTYWDTARVRLQAIAFHPIDSVDAEERAFRAGQLHITEALAVGKVDAYRRGQPAVLRIDPWLATYFFRINITRPGLDDPRVRRALAMAVDREAIVTRITRGGQQAAHSFVPPGFPGYQPPPGIPTDFAEARRLLAEAGHAGGRGLPPIEILFNTSPNHRLVAEAMQAAWQRELGVAVNLVNMEQKTVLEARRTLGFQILRSVWSADYLDPESFLSVFVSDSGNNHTGWSSPEYDGLLGQARATADPAARLALLRRAESLLLDAAPVIPVYFFTTVRLVHPSVRGWHPTLLDHHPYKDVWLEE